MGFAKASGLTRSKAGSFAELGSSGEELEFSLDSTLN